MSCSGYCAPSVMTWREEKALAAARGCMYHVEAAAYGLYAFGRAVIDIVHSGSSAARSWPASMSVSVTRTVQKPQLDGTGIHRLHLRSGSPCLIVNVVLTVQSFSSVKPYQGLGQYAVEEEVSGFPGNTSQLHNSSSVGELVGA
eukprot:6154611-Prymnesium_polylepis.1